MAKLAFKHASFEGRHIGDNELRAIEVGGRAALRRGRMHGPNCRPS